jgi:hypothetical protein
MTTGGDRLQGRLPFISWVSGGKTMASKSLRAVAILGCGLVLAAPAASQASDGWEEAKFTDSMPGRNEYFGCSVSVNGDYAFVGERNDQGVRGAAYMYERGLSGWTQQAKLVGVGQVQHFGNSVAVAGEYALAGAPTGGTYGLDHPGSASLFHRDPSGGWTRTVDLTPSDGLDEDWFGYSVAFSEDYALVGAPLHAGGAVYVFERGQSGWAETAKISAEGGYFGWSVSLSGNRAVVGAPLYDDYTGAAYVFERGATGWTQVAKLTASDSAEDRQFGYSLSISDDKVIVSIGRNDSRGGNRSGTAYIFEQGGSGWTEVAKLSASDGHINDEFGQCVSICGDRALVGASHHNGTAPSAGAAYVFQRGDEEWSEVAKLTASDAAGYDWFGYSVSLSERYALIGAIGVNAGGNDIDAGAVYVFTPEPGTLSLLALGGLALLRRKRASEGKR